MIVKCDECDTFILQECTDVDEESEDTIVDVHVDVHVDVNKSPVTTPTLSPTPNVEVSFMCLVCL